MPAAQRLPRTVLVLGWVSFLNDLASEMVTPLIPLVVAAIGAGPVALGLIEGTAEALASFLKLWSGRHSDWLGGRRKGLTLAGYVVSNLVRPLFGLAAGWTQLLALRSLDRFGKGLRTAPRDALLADATDASLRGRAYGFNRAMDNGGAMGGSLLAAAILAASGLDLVQVILLSAIPGLLGVLLVAFGVREPPRPSAAVRTAMPPLRWNLLPSPLRQYLLLVGLFGFARASETFLVLYGHGLGMGAVELLLLWAALSLAKSVTSLQGGRIADRIGHARVVRLGWVAHGLGFVLVSLADTASGLWLAALAYGLATGFAEGAERAVVAQVAEGETRGTAFGWYNMVTGLTAIPAGLTFGLIWQAVGAAGAFAAAAAIALLASVLLGRWLGAK
jgi:MFS family permease